jgi:azurin
MRKIIFIISSVVLMSCGGSSEKSENSNQTEKTSQTEVKTEATEKEVERELVEITLIAKGETMTEIAFEPKALNIPKNSRVILTLKNESVMAGMLHNFVLVALGSGQEIATAGIAAGEANSFVPADDRVIVNTKVLKMGEETTIEFDSPEVGSYHYICTFPGHYPNMIGRMNVQ